MTEEKFLIKTTDFEGPFSLLLELIRKKKLSINDVSLAQVVDEYVLFVKENELKLADASSFVVVAATLLLIKSKSLLPQMNLNQDEEEDIDELRKKLRYLKIIKSTSKNVKDIIFGNVLVKKLQRNKTETKFRPHENISLKNILISLDGLVSRSTFIKEIPEKKVEKQIPLKEVMKNIQNKVQRFLKLNFSELIESNDKKSISVSFLAILELFKNQQIELIQEETFGKIVIERKTQTIQ